MDFLGWKTELQDYAHKKNLVTKLAYFTDKAVSKIDTRFRGLENLFTLSIVANTDDPVPVPLDLIEIQSLRIGGQQVAQSAATTVDRAKANSARSYRLFYLNNGSIITTVPVLDADIDITYYRTQPALVNDTDTTPVMLSYPDLYTYLGMLEIGLYIEDFETASHYKALADEILVTASNKLWRYMAGPSPAVRSF